MKIFFDLHSHTIASGHAFSTLKENIKSASEKGLYAYGFSEHAEALPGGVTKYYFLNVRVVPKIIDGVHIFCGAEANIIDFDGNIDIDEFTCKRLDYVIASLHVPCIAPGNIEQNTNALIGAMRNPYVKIIGHPDDSRYAIDFDKVLPIANETGTIIELNNSSLNPLSTRHDGGENMRYVMKKCMEYGTKVILGSDSHIDLDVANFSRLIPILEELNFPLELIVNASISGLDLIIDKNSPRSLMSM